MKLRARILGREAKRTALSNGVIDLSDAAFKGIAAVTESGVCYVADGYRHADEFLEGLDRLQTSGQIPAVKDIETRRLEDIQALYRPGVSGSHNSITSESSQTRGQRRLLNLIADLAAARANDIKIYQHETQTLVRLKVAGREFDYGQPWTPEEGIAAIAFAFDQQDKGTGEVTLKEAAFQSFSISPKPKFQLPEDIVKLRGQRGYHESDTKLGSFMVLRLFSNDDQDTGTLEDLGFDDEVTTKLAQVRADLKGAVLIGGETGDGKSTTMIRALEALYDEHSGEVSIVTLEDPVEYRLRRPGVIQISLRSAGDEEERQANYRAALRNFVRINPDVGMVSEIRDGVGGREALQFATSGHAIYSTVHVDSANGIPFRLMALGVPAEELSQSGVVRLLLKQTLVPLLCDSCKQPLASAELKPHVKKLLEPLAEDEETVFLRNADGCEVCRKDTNETGREAWAGYQRQIAVGEVIEPDREYFEFVRERHFNGALAHWLKPKNEGGLGGVTLAQKMTELVLAGRVDPLDALRKHGDLNQRLTARQRADFKWGEG